MHKHIMAAAMVAAAAFAIAPAMAQTAASSSATVNVQQALDKPLDLAMDNVPISEVFAQLQAKTGVRFVIDDATMACLPYGDQTRVAVKLKNVTLRRDLGKMLAPQALQWIIDNDVVRIVPIEALARMCRRASYDELQILGHMYAEKLQPVEANGPAIDQLRRITGAKDLDIVIAPAGADRAAAVARADRILPASGAQWLDAFCQGQGWTWYLWGDEITIIERKAQIIRQLQQQVSLRYQGEKLVVVLLDLARKGRFTLTMDPGVLNYVPSEIRTNFNLIMADAPISQALEVISGATGLEFAKSEDGVRVTASEELRKKDGDGSTRRPAPFFVKMTISGPHGASYEVFIRAEELPDDVIEAIQAKKAELIDTMRGGKKPATVPSAPTGARQTDH